LNKRTACSFLDCSSLVGWGPAPRHRELGSSRQQGPGQIFLASSSRLSHSPVLENHILFTTNALSW
jgi:hypothetical protein